MKRWILLVLCGLLLLTGCSQTPIQTEFYAMNTVMQITLYDRDEALLQLAQEEILRLENLLSVTRADSEIYKVNQQKEALLSQETQALLTTALAISQQTDGLFDITVHPAVEAWGFINQQYRVPTQEERNELLGQIGYEQIILQGNTLTLPANVSIDLGGIAKGYAADQTAALLKEQGCTGGVLSLGGNVLTIGNKPDGTPFAIGVQDPADTTQILGTLSLTGEWAVVTSGDSQRYFEQDGVVYHHILDPGTAAPAQSDLTSVTVIHSSAAEADGYATALYIMGLEDARRFAQQHNLQTILVTKDKQVYTTCGAEQLFAPDNGQYTFH